jgi:hypothetical protein
LSFLLSYEKKYDTFGLVYFKISIFMVQESKHAFDYTCDFCHLIKRSMILLVLSTSKYQSLWFKSQNMLLITLVIFVVLWKEVWYFWFCLLQNIDLYDSRLKKCFWLLKVSILYINSRSLSVRDATVPRSNPPAEPARTVGFGKRDWARTVGFGIQAASAPSQTEDRARPGKNGRSEWLAVTVASTGGQDSEQKVWN